MTERILPKPKLLPKKHYTTCRHPAFYVVEEKRMLECQKCGCMIEPFDYLMKRAVQQNNVDISIRILVNEKKRLEQEVEELKRQRKNLMVQINRQKKVAC